MSLKYFKEKIKSWQSELFLSLLIILIGILGFGLGRLSKLEDRKVPIVISPGAPVSTVIENKPENKAINGQFVASKSGTSYYLPWCTGVQRIRESNKIWFKSRQEAESAGYKVSSTCKGM